MKKSPPTPDVNAQAPRPRRVSEEDPNVPTMDTPPPAPSDTATSFDRGTAATDQEYRSGLLPGSDDFAPAERTRDQLEGSDTFPQQNDPDQEGVLEQPGEPNHEGARGEDPNETLGAVKPPRTDARAATDADPDADVTPDTGR